MTQTIKISTWNVNSIRARRDSVFRWLEERKPDVALLQETKTTNEQFFADDLADAGYASLHTGEKSYNGVAILTRISTGLETSLRLDQLPGDEEDLQARYIEADVGPFTVASVYVPNGSEIGCDKYRYKLAFMARLRAHLDHLSDVRRPVILGGDYNIAPASIDVYDPVELEGTICFHADERAALRRCTHTGWYDCWREMHPGLMRFSWWPYQGRGYEQDHGYRIDHHLMTAEAMDLVQSCEIDEDVRGWKQPSDHAPVTAELSYPVADQGPLAYESVQG